MPAKQTPVRFVAVALHPGIDRTIEIPRLRPGTAMRGLLRSVEPAGKGVNVAHTLSNLGHHVLATGFMGADESDFFMASFRPDRVQADFVTVRAPTRHNITVVEKELGRDSHIIGGSMRMTRSETQALIRKMKTCVKRDDWVVFSGRPPAGVTQADYLSMLRGAAEGGGKLCVDCSGPMLRAALSLGPWVIKPNRDELEELVGRRLRGVRNIAAQVAGLLRYCGRVLVSLGPEGAFLASARGGWHAWDNRVPHVVHTVGCGDALLCGYLSASATGRSEEESLRHAVACGSACVGTPYPALRSRASVRRIMPHVHVERIL